MCVYLRFQIWLSPLSVAGHKACGPDDGISQMRCVYVAVYLGFPRVGFSFTLCGMSLYLFTERYDKRARCALLVLTSGRIPVKLMVVLFEFV